MAQLDSLFSSGIPQVSGIDSGSNPTRFYNEAKLTLNTYTHLPKKTSPSEVIKSAKRAEEMKARALLMSKLSKHRINAVNQSLNMLRTRTNHSKAMMNAKNQYGQIMKDFGEEVTKQSLNFSETNAQYQGYQAEMQNASGMIRF